MSLLSFVFYYINILERITSFVYVLDFFKNIMNITFNLLIIKKVNISIKGGV